MFMNNEKESLLEELKSTHSIIRFLNPCIVVIGHFASCSITVAKVMALPEVSAALSAPLILHPVDNVGSAPAKAGATGSVGGWVANSRLAIWGQVT